MRIQRTDDRIALSVSLRELRSAVILLAGLAAAAGLVWGVRASRVPATSAVDAAADSAAWRDAPRFQVGVDQRPSRGAADAPVTIVEFVDYGCPFCRRHADEVFPLLLERHGEVIRYVVRHFPIPALTPNALGAAEAAECAHRQGRFWAYKAALLAESDTLSRDVLRRRAVEVGLDAQAFDGCVAARATRDAVARDILDAWALGVTGTPTFLINGRRFRGRMPLERMELYVRLATGTR